MDPVGFALENFDAVGRWRRPEAGQPIDAAGGLPDGSEFAGVAGLEQALLDRPELFVRTLTEKLLTFALGRGVEYYDAPAVRQIVARRQRRRLSLLAADPGHCQQHAVSDEDVAMIVTKKALPRRTFLRGAGAALALPLLGRDDPVADRAGRHAGQPGAAAAAGLRLYADGLRRHPLDAAGRRDARRTVAVAQPARAGEEERRGDLQPGAAERLSGHARHFELPRS